MKTSFPRLACGLSVLVGLSLPVSADLVSYWNLDETEGATATDGNLRGVILGTKLDDPDSDGGTLTDGDEVNMFGSDPNLVDTDGDQIADNQELIDETDPLSPTPDEPGLISLWRLGEGALPQLLGARGITISAWLNADDQGDYNGIFMARQFNGSDNNSWGLAFRDNGGLYIDDVEVK